MALITFLKGSECSAPHKNYLTNLDYIECVSFEKRSMIIQFITSSSLKTLPFDHEVKSKQKNSLTLDNLISQDKVQ